MDDLGILNLVVVPAGLGLFGFIEPCTIGSTLLFAKYLEGKDAARKLVETGLFAATRAVFIGALGLGAVLLGSAFLGFQKGAWIALGAIYVLIGLLYLTRRARALMVSVGPRLSRRSGVGSAIGLGLLFGLNIPACAAPLILALLGAAAAGGSAGATAAHGFLALSVFGFALSLPLVVAVLVPRGRRVLEWLAGLSHRFPTWAGLVLVALGLWSIAFGLFVSVGPA